MGKKHPPIQIGQKFGKLTVIEFVGVDKYKSKLWKCKCDCGKFNIVRTRELNAGTVKSCGCGSIATQYKRTNKQNIYDLESAQYEIGYCNNIAFLFDKEDFNKIKDYHWTCTKNDYVKSRAKTDGTLLDSTIRMHILIMNSNPILYDVDHINHNIRNNRKENLRVILHNENLMNTKLYSNNTTGVKGVYWDKSRKKWMACITAYKKTYHLGRFDNFDDAVKARKEAEIQYHGEYRNKELR